jgi:hypothetical protein
LREVGRKLGLLSYAVFASCSMVAGSDAPSGQLFKHEASEESDAEAVEPEPAPEEVPAVAPAPIETASPAPVDDRPRPQKQWDHIASAAPSDCLEKLAASKAKFRALPAVAAPNQKGCGIPHGVMLTRGPTGLRYSPPVSIDCSLALHLEEVEGIIQEEAVRELGSPIASVSTLGSFACRGVVGRLKGWTGGLSEHSFGNAIDLSRFVTEKGIPASVMSHYEPGVAEPKTAQGRFLRSVQRRIRKEARLRALGPDFDASHRDHLHVDAGSPWWR